MTSLTLQTGSAACLKRTASWQASRGSTPFLIQGRTAGQGLCGALDPCRAPAAVLQVHHLPRGGPVRPDSVPVPCCAAVGCRHRLPGFRSLPRPLRQSASSLHGCADRAAYAYMSPPRFNNCMAGKVSEYAVTSSFCRACSQLYFPTDTQFPHLPPPHLPPPCRPTATQFAHAGMAWLVERQHYSEVRVSVQTEGLPCTGQPTRGMRTQCAFCWS